MVLCYKMERAQGSVVAANAYRGDRSGEFPEGFREGCQASLDCKFSKIIISCMPEMFLKLRDFRKRTETFQNKTLKCAAQVASRGPWSTVQQGGGHRVLWPLHPRVALPENSLKGFLVSF